MAGRVEGLGLHRCHLFGGEDLDIEGVGNVGEGRSPQGGKEGEQDRHLHQQGQTARQGAAELLHQLAQLLLLLLGVVGKFGFDLRLPLLHHGLGDPHASCAADGSGTEGEQGKSDHHREGNDRQAIAGHQPIEEIQDGQQQVVGDVADHSRD